MSFFKKIFSKEENVRKLTKADDLLKGDIILINDSFALPESLRGQRFEVIEVNCYEFEFETQTEWVLRGEGDQQVYLSLDKDDQVYLKFAIKLSHFDVESLFNLDDFAVIFEPEQTAELNKQSDTSLTQGWTSDYYRQAKFATVGFFHRKDNRTEKLSQYEGDGQGEQFEQYTLFDEDEDKGIDIEVWSDGETDVFLTMYRPLTDIADYFPGS